MEGLEFLAEASGFNGAEAMMAIVEQVQVVAELLANAGE
jgi:hypothetical protein